MGNKIFRFSSQDTQNNEEMEVYRDISMVAQRRQFKDFFIKYEDGEQKVFSKDVTRFQVDRNVNVKAIFNSLENIFSWIPGERILNPEFGSKLRLYLYEGITPENKELIASEIRAVCLKWEPRISIINVHAIDNTQDAEDNTVQVVVTFSIPGLSSKQYQYSYIYDMTH